MSKLENCSNVDEQTSAEIASEIESYISDVLGLVDGYEFADCLEEDVNNPLRAVYTCYIVLGPDVDSEEALSVFTENRKELITQLKHQFPGIVFKIEMTTEASGLLVSDDEDNVYLELPESDEEDDGPEDDECAQYEAEGLRIIDRIEDEREELDERSEFEDDEDEDEEDKPRKKRSKDAEEDFEDIDDDYVPSEEDKEELWKDFGDFGDE